MVFGSADAPVQIDLYADFHCPGCAQFEQNYGTVLSEAQQRGQAAIRFSPLTFHDPGSVSAGNGFACAAEAGFGQAFFTGLFANASLDWNNDQLFTLAEQVSGAPPSDAFRSCVTDRRHLAYLTSITAAADRSRGEADADGAAQRGAAGPGQPHSGSARPADRHRGGPEVSLS